MEVSGGVCGWLEWAVATRTAPGEGVCGDAWLIEDRAEHTVVALCDGLGHGPDARRSALAALQAVAATEGAPTQRITAAHRNLQRERGAALGVGVISHARRELTWWAVGNVEGVLVAHGSEGLQRRRLSVQAGIVGDRLPRPRETTYALAPGEALILATDGVQERFLESVLPALELERAALKGLEAHLVDGDDATVFIARCRGGLAK